MSSLDSLLNIAMAGAIIDSYDANNPDPKYTQVNILLVRLRISVENCINLWQKVDFQNYKRFDLKIQKMQKVSCLGKPESIIVYIDFITLVLEDMLPFMRVTKYCAIKLIIDVLILLRNEFALNLDEFDLSYKAIECKAQWEEIKI